MKKTVYIHIGTHKTGTTSIQKFSVENSTKLFELGIYYPTISRPMINNISAGHHLLPWYIFNHPVPGSFYGEYNEKRESLFPSLIEGIKSSACDHILLSSEEFDRLSKEDINRLSEYFTDFNVKIIAYLRRKDSYMESMYQTDVLHNVEYNSFAEYMKIMPTPQNYYKFIKKWQDVFGLENVQVNFYCKKALKSNDIVVDFYSRLGLDVENMIKKDETKEINASVPFQYVGLIAMVRRMKVSDEIVNSIKRIAYKIRDSANKDFHFLSLAERIKLADSGLKEIRDLNLSLPDEECFSLSEDEKKRNVKQGNFSALKQVFADFENYMNKSNIK